MADATSLKIIVAWCSSLADQCRHGNDGRPTRDKLATLATLLAEDFPSAAFTIASLHFCLHGNEYFPSYDGIRERIGEWWRHNKPRTGLALAGPLSESPLTGNDLDWERFYYKRAAENFAAYENQQGSWAATSRGNVLGLIRKMSPLAWQRLTGESLFRRNGDPADDEKAYVTVVLDRLRAELQGPDLPVRAMPLHSRELTPDELVAYRQNAGIRPAGPSPSP
jgi:hypothetical protein